MGFTEKQEALVKESWKVMKQNIPEHSLRFFTLMLEIAPEVKNSIHFLKDSDEIPKDNPKFKAHALIVFKMVSQLVLREVPLMHLGSVHLKKGVVDSHFEVMKEALLRTIKEAVGESWSDEMGGAWGEAYDQLAATIKTQMEEEAAQTQLRSN
ncbi:non-symbiotic hemoglobin 2 [Quercus suber]|uniref:Non-symbiotic hemoglobin 2 n=1 Tax=Quercus suber TaxID=58331 RepID=A0AAW0KE07_QUESU